MLANYLYNASYIHDIIRHCIFKSTYGPNLYKFFVSRAVDGHERAERPLMTPEN
jgi:hypothetical protein